MEKEQNQNLEENKKEDPVLEETNKGSENNDEKENQLEEKNPEDKILELEDKLARTFAEMENQRRRFEKEKDEAFEYGGFTLAKEALNLLDNLERSKQILQNDVSLKSSEAQKKMLENFDIINKDLINIFERNRIKKIDTKNKKFDPNLHQAMSETEDDSKDTGSILQEIQSGYMLGERLLRPSLVSVAKKKTPKKEEKNQKKEDK